MIQIRNRVNEMTSDILANRTPRNRALQLVFNLVEVARWAAQQANRTKRHSDYLLGEIDEILKDVEKLLNALDRK